MFRALVLLLVFGFGMIVNAESSLQQWGLGVALESRVQRDVNPDMGDLRHLGGLFAKYKFDNSWTTLVEMTQEKRDSSSGSYSVHSESLMASLWGRYEFSNGERAWRPYASLGAGMYFDKAKTKFQNTESVDKGDRKLAGLGVGVTSVLFGHLLLEGEGRMYYVELTKDPVFSLVFRVGAAF